MIKNGKRNWYIADGWLPSKKKQDNSDYQGHEAIMILNCNGKDANISMDIYFEDKPPIEDIKVIVGAKRVRCLRVDNAEDMGGIVIERYSQYSIRFKSNIEVVIQYGRMDISQDNLAYIGMMGYGE
jgi:hypothetical protein